MFIEILTIIVSVCYIFSGGWILAKIKLPLRYLASGGLAAFGIFMLDSAATKIAPDLAKSVMLVAALAINASIVYFSYLANKLIYGRKPDTRQVATDTYTAPSRGHG